jgi:hypothetical protein
MSADKNKLTNSQSILVKIIYGVYLLTGLVVAFIQVYNLMVKAKTPSI